MKRIHRQDVSMTAPSRPMWRRTIAVFAITVLCYTMVGGKLAVLQLSQHGLWQALAEEQQLSDSVVSDKRGLITDRAGVVLAQSTEVATVILSPSDIPDDNTRRRISDDLSVMLGVDREKLYQKTGKTFSRYETVKTKISAEQAAQFADWVKQNGYTGIFRIIRDYKREYPLGNTLSCVLGFTGTDNTGLEGLEAKYNTTLAGKAGRIVTAKNGWGDALPNNIQYETAIEAAEGNRLTLTVDAHIQQITEKYLDMAVAQTAAANRACAIVMDVKTCEVLAMATKTDYNLNEPRTLTDPTVAAQIAQMAGDEKSAALLTALQQQWKNKAVSEFYEPGSVFKIFTASMALEENLISPRSHFFCGGTFQMAGVRTMKCHIYPRSHGDQSLAEAISHSCNPAFMKIGSLVGTKLFPQYHEAFGFTSLTGIDMLGEARVTPTLYHAANVITAVDVATSSIGQTFKVTPIQMITGVCAVAGGGVLRQPYVVSRITAPDGTAVREIGPTEKRRVISEKTAQTMCEMLEGVVDGGGAKNAYVAGYRVAGKTGTSEKTDQKAVSANGRKGVVASFCGFAPANDPKIAVIVMIDEPQTAIRYGGTLAAPVAGQIFADVLPYLGVQPQYTEEERKALECTVPDVTNKTVSAAAAALKSGGFTYRVVGDGSQVLRQSPVAGTVASKGGSVVLYTDGAAVQTATVPDTLGKSLTEANRLLADAGLNVRLSGWVDRDPDSVAVQEAVIGAQSTPAGEQVPLGTTITITVRYQSKD